MAEDLMEYTVDVWDEESMWTYVGLHPADPAGQQQAEAAAVAQLNADWHTEYASYTEMRSAVEGVTMRISERLWSFNSAQMADLYDALFLRDEEAREQALIHLLDSGYERPPLAPARP